MNRWMPVEIEMNAIDSDGEPISLSRVRAEKNTETGKVRVSPEEVSKAEVRQLAEEFKLEDRDVALLLVLHARPGPFKAGIVHYKYHLNKMLFYQWKRLEKLGLGEAYPHDTFKPARKGPVPVNITQDLKRLEAASLLTVRWGQYGKSSTICELTQKGTVIAQTLWARIAPPFRDVTQKVKEDLFPLDPVTVMEKVHREFPEFRKTYVVPDTD